jgi:hypothetical protein
VYSGTRQVRGDRNEYLGQGLERTGRVGRIPGFGVDAGEGDEDQSGGVDELHDGR